MNKLHRFFSLGALLLLLLSTVALAGSKVAIIKVSTGSASLDGKTVGKATMAAEGQTLEVPKGSSVRIQLLGSKDEVTLAGPVNMKIEKSSLQKQAKEVSRNSAAVAADIGNKNTASASVTRGEHDGLTALKPILPPRRDGEDYLLAFEAGEEFPLRTDHSITVEVVPVEGDGPRLGHTFTDDDPLVPLALPKNLEIGQGYRFTLIYSDPGQGPMGHGSSMYTYKQTFRMLTPDQKEFLNEAKTELMGDYKKEKDILPLLRLASLYQEYDQNKEVLEYLKMAYNSPYLENQDHWNSLRTTIYNFEQSMVMPVPLK